MIFYASYAFGVVLFMCELGQRLGCAFEQVGDEIESFEWNLFSREIQKKLPLIFMVAQEPVLLECFGSTSGNRDTFKKVSLAGNNCY